MPRKRAIALVLVGVAFNNYVYLHDIIMNKHEGFILVGPIGVTGIIVALTVVAAGLMMLVRAPAPPPQT